jgi:hydrogenase-1 operon protein HyaE
MTHPLIDRLTCELGWPRLALRDELDAFVARPGVHVVFVPGDPARNLETTDVAVILPELVQALQGRFDCAVADDAVAAAVGEAAGSFKTPNLVFFRDGTPIDAIAKVRDWSDYMARIGQILARPLAVE